MTRFFEHQDDARRNTRVLVVLMVLAVIALGSAIYGLVHVMGFTVMPTLGPRQFQWKMLAASIFGTAGAVGLASLGRMLTLGSDGAKIAEMMGGRLVNGHPQDDLERRLVNVVEEMAIASGVPVPQTFVLDQEEGINAFAAGLTIDDAAIAVTRGCLEKLTRDELQGVVAHEFSHVLNGDMRLNLRLMGIVFGIICIALLGRMILRGSMSHSGGRRGRSGGAAALPLLGLGLLLIGLIGELFGKLIKAAVSRQREFLADASAVQFTRNPSGIAGALKKIGGFGLRSRVDAPFAEEASHFFFGDIKMRLFEGGMLATHPPLAERVRRVDPTFEGEFPSVGAGVAEAGDTVTSALAGGPPAAGPADATPAAAIDAQVVRDRVGTFDAVSIAESRNLIAALSPALRHAANSPFGASAIVHALLLSEDAPVRRRQCELVDALAGPPVRIEAVRLSELVRTLERRQRLPLVELCAPALRELSTAQRAAFARTIDALVAADGRVSIFEYVLAETVRDRVASHEEKRPERHHRTLASVRSEVVLLLSLLAHAGAANDDAAARAFEAGAGALERGGVALELLRPSERLLSALAPALSELRGLAPKHAAEVVDACARVVVHDRRINDDEATLLRAVCGALRCPLPPFAIA